MRHTGLYFTEGDEHLDLFTTDLHEAGHTTGDTVWKGALTGESRASYEGLIQIVPKAQEIAHLPADALDAALAEGEGRRDPVADRRDRQRLGLARRHRRRARRGADLLHDDPRHPARRGGAGPASRATSRRSCSGSRTRASRTSCGGGSREKLRGAEDQVARVHRRAGGGRADGRDRRAPARRRPRRLPGAEPEFDGRRVAYLDSAATSQKPRAGARRDGRATTAQSNAHVHRSVYELARESTDAFEGARERIAAVRRLGPGDARSSPRNATEAINLVAYSWGRANVGAGRRGAHHRDGAPLEHRARGSSSARSAGARLRYLPRHRGRRAVARRARRGARRGPRQARRVRARLERARHDQPGRGDRRRARAAGRGDPRRRRAGGAAAAGRPERARRRLLRLDRPQGARPDRHRRAARPPRAARGDAAVPRRRPHDLARRARELDLERAALEVRGRHVADRRGRRPRRRRRLPGGDRHGATSAPTSAS